MGLFEVLASSEDTGSRAVIAAQTRAKSVFERYVGNDAAKLAFIADDLRKMATDVAYEYGHDNVDELYGAAIVALAGGHPADCTCAFCENKGSFGKKDEDGDEEKTAKTASTKTACDPDCDMDHEHDHDEDEDKKEASVQPYAYQGFDWEKVAAEDDRSGDSYQHERESLPESDGTGLGDTGAVPTDRSKSGDQTGWNLEPIDVDSQRHQLEHQDAPQRAEYNNEDFDPSNPVRERVDADKPMQPEFTSGPDTQTWSDAGTQASPVTSKWSLLA